MRLLALGLAGVCPVRLHHVPDTARNDKVADRTKTKEIGRMIGFVFGTFASLADFRAQHGLLVETTRTTSLSSTADAAVTGAVVAGGGESVHRMANVSSGFMDSLSASAGLIQKEAVR